MDARLAKVRQRKLQQMKEAGLEVPPEGEGKDALDLTDFDFDSTGKKEDKSGL